MESKYRRKTIYKAGSALLLLLMTVLILAAFREEGTGTWYLYAAAAAAVLIVWIHRRKSLGGSRGAGRFLQYIVNILPFAAGPLLALWLLQNFTLDPFRIYPMMLAANAVFYYLFYLMLVFLTGSVSCGCIAADWIFLILGTANYFVVQFRGSPIVPWDLFSLGTAALVAGNYTYEITWRFVFSFFGFLALIVLHGKNTLRIRPVSVRLLLTVLCAAGLLTAGVQLQKRDVKEKLGMDVTLFTPNVRYRNNGFLAAFLGNIHLIQVQQPEGYSVEAAESIAEETKNAHTSENAQNTAEAAAAKIEAGQMPHIIVIMDEAFSDLKVLGDFQTDKDYMPNFRRLMENGGGGHLMVSVKGGNTANTEFEFLSGDTMAFLPSGSVVYQQFIRDNIPVLPSYLASLGYATTAIHPYLASGWDRNKVYPLLGFEDFLSQDDFTDPRKLRLYISDESAFNKIIELYESRREDKDPQFIFEVTMQNHSGYSKEYPGFSEQIHLLGTNYENTQTRAVEKYMTLIWESDQALGNLMSYFEKEKEPVIIIMFGDHQPSDYITNVIDRMVGYNPEASIEEAQKAYIVPYFVWNNFGMDFTAPELVSVNYLAVDILKAAGLPLTTYHEFLLDLQQQIPVITAGAYVDADGNYHAHDEENELSEYLNLYNILQYNHMTDISHRLTGVFADPAGSSELP